MNDDALVTGALRGDSSAYCSLVDQYKSPVYNLAFRMLGNAEDAEDAAQETFSSWLLSITAHHCIDQLRRRRFAWLPIEVVDSLDWLWPDTGQPEQSAIDGEDRDEVRRLLHLLPDKYRLVLVLRYWHDLSYQEIAEVTKMSEAAVKTRLHRARAMLSEHVTGDGALRPPDDEQRGALTRSAEDDRTYARHSLVARS
jgi:RNA polymerase sigma-70 factor (ECF subfamily)